MLPAPKVRGYLLHASYLLHADGAVGGSPLIEGEDSSTASVGQWLAARAR